MMGWGRWMDGFLLTIAIGIIIAMAILNMKVGKMEIIVKINYRIYLCKYWICWF